MIPDFSSSVSATSPFPHFRAGDVLEPGLAAATLRWLKHEAEWRLRIEDFYEQHEIGLLDSSLPEDVAPLVTKAFVDAVREELALRLPTEATLHLVNASAHRLTAGQTIRVHNDHLGDEETHRLLVQLNEGWSAAQGGLLLLFAGEDPETLTDAILPVHRSGFGFAISATSHHAVSTIAHGERFTLVYTFRERP